MKAIRDNLNSTEVDIDLSDVLGTGSFRIAFRGSYTNGERNGQDAACKRFHDHYQLYEDEYYMFDSKVIDKAAEFATFWNEMCQRKDSIRFTRGDTTIQLRTKYMFEPLIYPYIKYTNNAGYLLRDPAKRTTVECLEAFSHFTYHKSGGNMIVCDLQGIYKLYRHAFSNSHYRLTDPAICSQSRSYGVTDMGEKGIETFFYVHKCNQFCQKYGQGKWRRPKSVKKNGQMMQCWFDTSQSSTSMMLQSSANLLVIVNPTKFDMHLQPIQE